MVAGTSSNRSISPPYPGKFQHAVFYVRDLEESQTFYQNIFDVQYSATNHPDSSAAMRLVGHTMKFFSFGYYHHDICFVYNPKVAIDHEQWSHLTFKLPEDVSITDITERLRKYGVPYQMGRFLPVPWQDSTEVIHFTDPNGHVIEVVE